MAFQSPGNFLYFPPKPLDFFKNRGITYVIKLLETAPDINSIKQTNLARFLFSLAQSRFNNPIFILIYQNEF
jgi:hypothetical protein